ncbi:MAG TPA: hypothetical protein PK125_03270 [Syntrophorhabdus sp.]|nr:hypothetical protein [Syntrophorhabdus sp.]HPW36269.1 hypothetical protein [Syntrophorhabdus sp.]HQB35623.1 hypothetical protein [Syntrophorhabdus sp.]HQO63827.1 hypothetical protein [Syntrophorhabdus sp.]HQP55595.1 hypothetical protein [Syntrophorhabdus sp.]
MYKEEFRTAKDGYRNKNHVCAEGYRESCESCVTEPIDVLALCKAPCKTRLDEAAANCRGAFAKGTPERDMCIDHAQVVTFQSSDEC